MGLVVGGWEAIADRPARRGRRGRCQTFRRDVSPREVSQRCPDRSIVFGLRDPLSSGGFSGGFRRLAAEGAAEGSAVRRCAGLPGRCQTLRAASRRRFAQEVSDASPREVFAGGVRRFAQEVSQEVSDASPEGRRCQTLRGDASRSFAEEVSEEVSDASRGPQQGARYRAPFSAAASSGRPGSPCGGRGRCRGRRWSRCRLGRTPAARPGR